MSRSAALDSRDDFPAIGDPAIADARESLAYWEGRAQRLPLRSVRQRREAREMAARWHVRVAQAEREAYGRGLVGLLLLLVAGIALLAAFLDGLL